MQTTRLEVMPLNGLIEIRMPQQILDKIKFSCRAINKVEWSGILFYKPVGDINQEGFSVDLIDILLMNKGTAAYTEYEFDENVAMFMMANKLMDCKMGHIHSHNTMGVFFSGTDMEELNDNSACHNYYLSLIVNNFMDFKAKVAFRGKANVTDVYYSCMGNDGACYSIPGQPIVREVMFTKDCTILSPNEDINVPAAFKARLEAVVKESDTKFQEAAEANKTKPSPSASPSTWTSVTTGHNRPIGVGDDMPFITQGYFEDGAIYTKAQKDKVTDTELFTCVLARMGLEVAGDDLEAALEDFDSSLATVDTLTAYIESNYAELYANFFEAVPKEQADEVYAVVINEVIDNFEDFEGEYSLSPLVVALRAMASSHAKRAYQQQKKQKAK